jgi:hypothetical protein
MCMWPEVHCLFCGSEKKIMNECEVYINDDLKLMNEMLCSRSEWSLSRQCPCWAVACACKHWC